MFTCVIVRRWKRKCPLILLIYFCETKDLVSCVEQMADFGDINKAIE